MVDVHLEEPLSDTTFYLTEAPSGGLRVTGGEHVAAGAAVATVLFLARPPLREVGMPTAEVLQL